VASVAPLRLHLSETASHRGLVHFHLAGRELHPAVAVLLFHAGATLGEPIVWHTVTTLAVAVYSTAWRARGLSALGSDSEGDVDDRTKRVDEDQRPRHVQTSLEPQRVVTLQPGITRDS